MKKASMIFKTVMIAIDELKKISQNKQFKGAVGDAITVIVMLYDQVASRKVDGELRLIDQWRSELIESALSPEVQYQSTDRPARARSNEINFSRASMAFLRGDLPIGATEFPKMTDKICAYSEPDWNAPLEMSLDGLIWFPAFGKPEALNRIRVWRVGPKRAIIYRYDIDTRYVTTPSGKRVAMIRNDFKMSAAMHPLQTSLNFPVDKTITFDFPISEFDFAGRIVRRTDAKDKGHRCSNCDRPKPTNEDYKRTAKMGVDKSLCFVRGNTDCVEHTVDWRHRTLVAEEALRAIVERGVGASRKILLDELSTGSIPRQIAEKIYAIREELDSAAQLSGQVEQKLDSEKNHWCQVVANIIIDKLKG